ncbi:uncharacterized protein HMPREF1120_08158 [Exophiala dermatitidis NIH/UT8656]|uniref:Secreted protein n=1 Tax=Exophiala dermatitidis (strain ATCC 34100 / CBS 525.76 / NIH/UT8656) TaxID=858893 RepID=H6CAM4_EXODN|nr:uncharacterized protein HMPREF1120_08158 [Exophiala dermatitidis NIH/UT8656]EHY60188.1 hypothetical protein HMPREF1120_08158 [Exophiala dermatitidis NIH/UT8656]
MFGRVILRLVAILYVQFHRISLPPHPPDVLQWWTLRTCTGTSDLGESHSLQAQFRPVFGLSPFIHTSRIPLLPLQCASVTEAFPECMALTRNTTLHGRGLDNKYFKFTWLQCRCNRAQREKKQFCQSVDSCLQSPAVSMLLVQVPGHKDTSVTNLTQLHSIFGSSLLQ